MKKYIVITLCINTMLCGMENTTQIPVIHTVCEWTKNDFDQGYNPLIIAHYHIINKYPLYNLTVFNTTGNKGFAAHLAKTAQLVHSVDEIDSNDIHETQKKYAHIVNLIFIPGAQKEKYDLLSTFQLPSEKSQLRNDLSKYYLCLKPKGEIFSTIVIQNNEDSFEQINAQEIYTTIYNSMPSKQQKNFDPTIYSKEKFITQEILDTVITETGYEIASQTNRFFDFYIKDILAFKTLLKMGFTEHILSKFELSSEKCKFFCKKFVTSVLAQLKKNENNDFIYPYNITEIHIRKK